LTVPRSCDGHRLVRCCVKKENINVVCDFLKWLLKVHNTKKYKCHLSFCFSCQCFIPTYRECSLIGHLLIKHSRK
jgi:hypothetical protein